MEGRWNWNADMRSFVESPTLLHSTSNLPISSPFSTPCQRRLSTLAKRDRRKCRSCPKTRSTSWVVGSVLFTLLDSGS